MCNWQRRFELQVLTVLLVLCFTAAGQTAPVGEPRTALVIGNSDYSFAPLPNPVHDATDVASALRNDGFEVTLETEADQPRMDQAIRGFGDALKTKGGVGLFYFSGHGVQVNGQNYMVPIGQGITSERDLKYRAVNANEVLDAMAAAGNGLNIVILDACRNNPLLGAGRGLARGLARIDSNAGLFVSFSTSPGAVALDGDGRNSPYTKYLVGAISSPDLSLEETFKRTLKGVHQETAGQQTPWISSSFFGDFVFKPTGSASPATAALSQETAARDSSARQLISAAAPVVPGIYRADGTNPNGESYHGMVALSRIADGLQFTWWIGRQVFSGAGRFAGRMLVVDWGQPHPVIYTLGGPTLQGEWADGSATENLELFAEATDDVVPPPEGRYRVAGRNPNGSPYAGTVIISKQANRLQLKWEIGPTGYGGSGTIEGNLLKVDWGATTPVVYAIASNGILSGLWDAGRGEEILTPDHR